ncbi:hypothetical protein AVEN_237413-1 [Araneus ventricosus]|uniref:Uncharacterized protein n=1 Tax=Araneus ventricosus TaxID=182803 RepID=A0A4Y2PTG5_ARAVE|nr:hypothetical protein AVEN_237413-1 [Araneus ventricosus]
MNVGSPVFTFSTPFTHNNITHTVLTIYSAYSSVNFSSIISFCLKKMNNNSQLAFGGSINSTSHVYCPTARRKTLRRVPSNRRVEERRDAHIKSTATFGKLSALPLGEEFVFERSTKRNETSASSIYAK